MTSENGFVPVVRELDQNTKFLIWNADSVLVFFAGFTPALYLGHFVIGIVLGTVLTSAWNWLKRGKAKGFAVHSLYWFFPGRVFRHLPPSWMREFRG